MKTIAAIIAAAALSGGLLNAAPQSYDFKDPKGVNNAVFKLDAPLEAINGTANGVSGTLSYDPANPEATTGKITVSTASLHVPNPVMKEHLHGAQWIDVANNPDITFEITKLSNVKTLPASTISADVTGKFTLHGVTKEITVPAKATYLADKLGQRTPGQKGDLLVIRSTFTIKRTDYGINPGAPQDKVADEIELTLSLAGASPK
jgi:polyisoprenoid-binding protein YceI